MADLPSDRAPAPGKNPPKFTRQKDARIRVLLQVSRGHEFPDVARKPPDPDLHVGGKFGSWRPGTRECRSSVGES